MYLGQWYRETIQGWGVFITKLRDVYKGSFVDNLYEGNNTVMVDVRIDKLRRPHMLHGGDATMEVNYSKIACVTVREPLQSHLGRAPHRNICVA